MSQLDSSTSTNANLSLSRTDLLAILFIVIVWGTNFIAMKWALLELTPFQTGAARFACAALPWLFFYRFPKSHTRWVIIYGLCQGVLQFGCLFVALKIGMTSSMAAILLQNHVFFTAILAFFLLGERLNRQSILGLCLAAIGLGIFIAHLLGAEPLSGASKITLAGFICTVCAAAFWGTSNIIVRLSKSVGTGYDPFAFLIWSCTVAVLPLLALSFIFDPVTSHAAWFNISLRTFLCIIFLGWFATAAAYGLWTKLLQKYPANRVAPFSLAVPPVGISAGMFFLGEQIQTLQWLGIAFLLAAVACVMFGDKLKFLASKP